LHIQHNYYFFFFLVHFVLVFLQVLGPSKNVYEETEDVKNVKTLLRFVTMVTQIPYLY
jgi:hypothetical protein